MRFATNCFDKLLRYCRPQADLNAPDSRGLRPIHLAAMLGLSDNVRALLAAGIPVDAMGAEGNTALHLAAYNKQDGAVAVLMRAGHAFALSFSLEVEFSFDYVLLGGILRWSW